MAGQEGIEEIKARLSNIRSVEPILGAMRTIALGSWQSALGRKTRVRRYSERLFSLFQALLPSLRDLGRGRHLPAPSPDAVTVVLLIGSERGLCGAFNSTLLRYAQQVLDRYQDQDVDVELGVLGERPRRMLERLDETIAFSRALPMTSLPDSELAQEWVQVWLDRYEAYELNAVDVIYNAYRSSTTYEPVTVRLIPPSLPPVTPENVPWPPLYVDTDPIALYNHLVALWTTTEMYRLVLDSAAAEHSTRFQLMEGATQNSNRLIDELTLALQSARQQAITTEMQELATGAGLLGGQT